MSFWYSTTDSGRIGSWIFYDETNMITYEDTEWNEFEAGTITISDWENTITMLDRNLWATSNNPKSYCSHGYYYQRWNNYWFPLENYNASRGHSWEGCDSEPTWSHTNWRKWELNLDKYLSFDPINRKWNYNAWRYTPFYWPWNRYFSDKFVAHAESEWAEWTNEQIFYGDREYFWDNDRQRYRDLSDYEQYDKIANLRWWGYDEENNNRNYWNPTTDRQWPCPEWYHIPSGQERNKLIQIRINIKNIDNDKVTHWNWWSISIDKEKWSNWFEIFNSFKFPYYAWYLDWAWSVGIYNQFLLNDLSINWYYRASTPNRRVWFNNDGGFGRVWAYDMKATPVRCFKDEPIDTAIYNPHPDKTITYNANWWHFSDNNTTKNILYTRFESTEQYVTEEYTIQIPHRDGYMFDWWYTNISYTTKWIQQVDDSTQNNQTIYAKWIDLSTLNNVGIFYDTVNNVSYTDPNGNSFEAWTITISDGENTITILDRNLWASSNNPKSYCSHGYYYQRWNIYGFPLNGWSTLSHPSISDPGCNVEEEYNPISSPHNLTLWWRACLDSSYISTTKHTRDQIYWPSNYFKSNKFIMYHYNNWYWSYGDWEIWNLNTGIDSSITSEYIQKNQWWWWYDNESNNRDSWNNRNERQGPCPSWYHVPSKWELLQLIGTYIKVKNAKSNNRYDGKYQEWYFIMNNSNTYSFEIFDDLLLPYYAWNLIEPIGNSEPTACNQNFTSNDGPVIWELQSSTKHWHIIFNAWWKFSLGSIFEESATQIRCFKDEPLDPNSQSSSTTYTLTINYQYEWWWTAKPTYTATLNAWSNYNVQSPTIEWYTANKTNVSGTINSNTTITVTYTKNTSSWWDTWWWGWGWWTTSTSNTITLTTNRSNPYTNQYINLTINNTNKNYTDKLYLSAKYRSSSSSDWYSISNNVSSTYFTDYSNEREDGYYKMKESDNWKVTLTNLVQFKKSGYYRIYVKDVNWNEKYISFTVDSDDDTSSENEYLDISISPSSPDTNEWIKLNIKTDNDYTWKINFSKFQYRSSSSSSWSTISRISSTYVSDHSSTRSNGYYKMKSSDDGEVTLKNLIKFKKGGYYRIYVEDTDDNEEYVQFYVESNDDEEETNSNKKSRIAIDITNQYPYTNNRIWIIINVDTDYTWKINFKKIEYYNNSSRKDVSSSSEYIWETSNEWDNWYYKMVSNDYGYKRISNFIKLKKEWKYRIYAETKDWVSDYIQFSVTEYNSTEYNETYTNTGRAETSTDDDIEAMLNQLLNPTWNTYNYTWSSYTESTNLYIDTSDEIYKSRSCKEYKLQYNSDLWAFTSPDLQKTEYFINKDYFKRYIDSKNPRKEWCPSNEWWISSSYVDNSNNTDKYIAPNWKIYFILYENWKYHSNQLTKTVDFPSYNEIKYYIRDRNPLINMTTNTK